MKHLRKMNNFNSYLAILSAVDSGPVQRLDWPKHITDTIKDFSHLIENENILFFWLSKIEKFIITKSNLSNRQ